MEMVIFIGAQASGKSSFYRERFLDSHVRINLDMLRTRHRESILVSACLEAKQNFVVDNTNPTTREREKYFNAAASQDVKTVGYYFQSCVFDCVARNESRAGEHCVPNVAIISTIQKLQLPLYGEGFDKLHFVRLSDGGFEVEEWKP